MSAEAHLVRGLSVLLLILSIVGGIRALDRMGRPATLTALEAEAFRESRAWRRSTRPARGRQVEALARGVSLDINAATGDELRILPGIGPSLAARIVEYREREGAFEDVAQLVNVRGVGPTRLASWRHLLRVEPQPVESR